jgi:multiple sugar transport system substrate-binding protein
MNRTFNANEVNKFDRILLILGLVLLAAGLLFALMARKTSFQRNTTVVFTQWWQDEMEDGALAALADEFESLNPGIRIQLDNRPYAEILGALRSNGEQPLKSDIVSLDPFWFEDLVRQDILEPLDGYAAPDGESPESPEAPDQGYEKWGRHLISFTSPLYYNIALLQAAGFDRPPKTRADLLVYARAVTDAAAGRYALALALGPENPQGVYRDIFSWLWASGPAAVREARPDFSARAIIGTLAFLKQMQQEGLIVPGTFSKTEAEKWEDFIQGRAAMMIASVSDIHILRGRMGADGASPFRITLVPGESSLGTPTLGLSSWRLGIPRAAAHKDEAWAFLSFLLERGAQVAEKAHAVPGSRGSAMDFIAADPLYAKAYDMYVAAETVQEFSGMPRVDEFEALVREQVYLLFEEDQSPEETAGNIQRYWEEL